MIQECNSWPTSMKVFVCIRSFQQYSLPCNRFFMLNWKRLWRRRTMIQQISAPAPDAWAFATMWSLIDRQCGEFAFDWSWSEFADRVVLHSELITRSALMNSIINYSRPLAAPLLLPGLQVATHILVHSSISIKRHGQVFFSGFAQILHWISLCFSPEYLHMIKCITSVTFTAPWTSVIYAG